MEVLIIFLIVVMIVQTVLIIYIHFIDISDKRLAAASQEMVANAQESFLVEKKRLQDCVDNRDKTIKELVKKCEYLSSQVRYYSKYVEKMKKDFIGEQPKDTEQENSQID